MHYYRTLKKMINETTQTCKIRSLLSGVNEVSDDDDCCSIDGNEGCCDNDDERENDDVRGEADVYIVEGKEILDDDDKFNKSFDCGYIMDIMLLLELLEEALLLASILVTF